MSAVHPACALVALALLAGGGAPSKEAERAAKDHFESAQKHYRLGRFEEAFREYQRAYELAPFPDLLFNMGQCRRNLKDYDLALFFFRSYLAEKKDAEDRPRVERLIAQLEQERAEARAGPPAGRPVQTAISAPAELTAAPQEIGIEPEDGGGVLGSWWFWAIVGVAAAGAAGGAILAARRGGGPDPMGSIGTIDASGR